MTDQRALCILCRSGQRMCLRGMSGTELKETTADKRKSITYKLRRDGVKSSNHGKKKKHNVQAKAVERRKQQPRNKNKNTTNPKSAVVIF